MLINARVPRTCIGQITKEIFLNTSRDYTYSVKNRVFIWKVGGYLAWILREVEHAPLIFRCEIVDLPRSPAQQMSEELIRATKSFS